jgi:hypothetical protein
MPARLSVRSCGFALLGAACGVLPVVAQTQLEIAPYVGLYWPTSSLASMGGAKLQQQMSVIEGARVTLWGPGRLGIEGTVGYARSDVWTSNALTYPARLTTGSVKARLRMSPPAARAALQVAGGVAWVGHCGYAYQWWYTGPWTFVGGIANVSAVIKLVRSLGLRFDAEDFVYAAHLGQCTRYGAPEGGVCEVYIGAPTNGPTGSRLQNDLVLSIGIDFACCPSGSRSQ